MDCLGNLCERGAAPGGPRRIATTRCSSAFHAGGGDISANKEAINASGALNRPRRSSGGTTASTASSFSEGSMRSEEHTSELQSRQYLVCRLLLEKKKKNNTTRTRPI